MEGKLSKNRSNNPTSLNSNPNLPLLLGKVELPLPLRGPGPGAQRSAAGRVQIPQEEPLQSACAHGRKLGGTNDAIRSVRGADKTSFWATLGPNEPRNRVVRQPLWLLQRKEGCRQ